MPPAPRFFRTYGFQLAVLALAGLTAANKGVERIRRRHDAEAGHLGYFSAYGVLGTAKSILYGYSGSRLTRNLVLTALVLALLTQKLVARAFPGAAVVRRRRPFVLTFLLGFWYMFYKLRVVETARVSYASTPFTNAVLERLRQSRRGGFSPVFWGFDGHTQTVLLNAANSLDSLLRHFVPYRREAIEAFDGNLVFLDWAMNEDKDHTLGPASPVVLVLHGIMGGADEPYARNLVNLCARQGWRSVVNWRWRLDFGEARDVDVAIRHIAALYPDAPIVAVGYSAGAHVLLTYLQAVGEASPLVAAVATSPAFDLVRVLNYVDQSPHGAVYGRALRYALRRCIDRHLDNDSKMSEATRAAVREDMETLEGNELYDKFLTRLEDYSGKELDDSGEAVFMPVHDKNGNGTSGHYNKTAAINMHKVGVTTLVVLAHDDPVLPPDLVAEVQRNARANPHIIMMDTKRGGHVAWHQGLLPSGFSWVDETTADFVSAVLAMHSQTRYILDVVRASGDGGNAQSTIRRICSTPRIAARRSGSLLSLPLALSRTESEGGHQTEALS